MRAWFSIPATGLVIGAALCLPARAGDVEASVKAGLLVQFLLYTERSRRPASESVTIAVVGETAVAEVLRESAAKGPVKGKKLQVLTQTEPAKGADVVFLDSRDRAKVKGWIKTLEGCGCLIVTAIDKGRALGAAVNFFTADDAVAFEANPEAAARESVQLGAPLQRHSRSEP